MATSYHWSPTPEIKEKLIISCGLAFCAVKEAGEKNKAKIDLLKLAMSYPLDKDFLAETISRYKEVHNRIA